MQAVTGMKDSLFFSQYGLHFLIIPGTAPGSGSPGQPGAPRFSAHPPICSCICSDRLLSFPNM
jgi:hypothetical protein